MTQGTPQIGRYEAPAAVPQERRESSFAHIGRGDESWICLCGYRGVRRALPEEASKAGYCVVCVDLYERQHGHPPWPRNPSRERKDVQLSLFLSEKDKAILAVLRDLCGEMT